MVAHPPLARYLGCASESGTYLGKQTIYVAEGQNIQEGLAAARKVWGNFPTAISVLIVDGLGAPGAGVLVEVDAVAVVG